MFCKTGKDAWPMYPDRPRCSRNDERDIIVWLDKDEKDGTVSKPGALFWEVEDPDEKKCTKCPLRLEDIKSRDVWYGYLEEFYCSSCYEEEKEALLERVYRHNDMLREMPRLLNDVKKQVLEHRLFGKSESLTKQYHRIEAKENKKLSSKDSKFLRSMWLYFYHRQAKPKINV